MVLDELVYDPGGSDNSMLVNLVQGTFVFVAGQIAPTGEMEVQTPVATLGIRGTTGNACRRFFLTCRSSTNSVRRINSVRHTNWY